MKKNSNCFLYLLAFLIVNASSRREISEKQMPAEIRTDQTITAGSDFFLPLASYGDEGELATLLHKGANFTISQLENESDQFT